MALPMTPEIRVAARAKRRVTLISFSHLTGAVRTAFSLAAYGDRLSQNRILGVGRGLPQRTLGSEKAVAGSTGKISPRRVK